MTLVKRIILSITRRPIKSLLLLVLSFALGTFIGSSYLISRAVNGLETNIKHNLDTYVVISYKDIDEYKNLNNVEYKDNQNKFLEKYNEISMKEYADLIIPEGGYNEQAMQVLFSFVHSICD